MKDTGRIDLPEGYYPLGDGIKFSIDQYPLLAEKFADNMLLPFFEMSMIDMRRLRDKINDRA